MTTLLVQSLGGEFLLFAVLEDYRGTKSALIWWRLSVGLDYVAGLPSEGGLWIQN